MKTCLIVDASNIVREVTRRMVSDLGLEPYEALSADEAVEKCRELTPDVVLLDWDLPVVGGLDFMREVIAFEPEKRPAIVLCTTENDEQQFALAKAAGAGYQLMKPFTKQTLIDVLAEVGVIDNVAEGANDASVGVNGADIRCVQ